MSGDHPGSPRRDDRQSFASQEPVQDAAPAPGPQNPGRPFDPFAPAPQPAEAQADDVRVAGGDRAAQAAPAGDTLGFGTVETGTRAAGTREAGGSRDEIASGRGRPSRAAQRGGSGKRNGLRVAAVLAGAAVVVGGGTVAAFALTGGSGDDAATVAPTKQVADAAPKVDPKVQQEHRRKLAMDRASREMRQYDGKGVDLRPKGEPIPTKTPEKKKDDEGGGSGGGGSAPPVSDPVPAGEAQQIAKAMLPSFGFSGDGQFGCLVKLWNKESGWNSRAKNPSSGAYGIPQALPGSKMASAGADWETSAKTQIKWGLGYIKDRYGTPCGAWEHSQNVGWY